MSDLISRQEVLKALEKHEKSNGHNYTMFAAIVSECEEIIRDVPSRQQWVRCSKKLPEEWEVLCCNKYGDYLLGHPYEDESSETGFSAESDEALLMDCTALMSLPEVYKGEKENEPGE